MRLENLTWPKAQEYFEKNDMVLISIGSIECHGRHMPLGTDTLIPEHLLEKIEKKSDVLIAPTIPYGSSPGLAPYPGSIDIDSEVLYQFCRQVFLSLYRHGARKFVFLNGHGGNIKMIERLGMEFEDKGCLVAMLNWWLMAWDMNPAWKGGHGGGEETAAILGIDPTLYEAAAVDGAGRFRRIWHITLPGIRMTVALLAILALGNVLNAGFDQIYNLYNPLVYSTGDIIDTWVYRYGLQNLQFSLATTVGLFKSVISLILITLGYWLADKFTGYKLF